MSSKMPAANNEVFVAVRSTDDENVVERNLLPRNYAPTVEHSGLFYPYPEQCVTVCGQNPNLADGHFEPRNNEDCSRKGCRSVQKYKARAAK